MSDFWLLFIFAILCICVAYGLGYQVGFGKRVKDKHYDFELAEVLPDDSINELPLVSHINIETMKVLINRQNQLFKRIQELENKITTMEVKDAKF